MMKMSNFMNGVQRFWRVKWICLIGAHLCVSILRPTILPAQEKEEAVLPSPELIEFLGSFEDDDMGWVDPFRLLIMEDAETDRHQDEGEKEEVNDET